MNTSQHQISAIVCAFRRVELTLDTINCILACEPPPNEVLVHVDGGEFAFAETIRERFHGVVVLVSDRRIGPGGARNRLISECKSSFVASFDDDSYPLDTDYFARITQLMELYPQAAILNATVFHQGEQVPLDERRASWVADFSGGACIYRRGAFLETSGYVPLATAYGMEEVDLGLRMHAQRKKILYSSWLRVFHDTDLKRHAAREITSASIANIALLAYLRYPPLYWPVGLMQCVKRIGWLVANGRVKGIANGLLCIPGHLFRNLKYRNTVSATALRSYLALRRHPVEAEWPNQLRG